eukprot:1192946-Prorocentrum_minimum.AAC.10
MSTNCVVAFAGHSGTTLTNAHQESKHVLVDSSLRDWRWYKEIIMKIRRKYPERQIGIIYVEAERRLVYERARARAFETGRVVPRRIIDAALDQVSQSVAKGIYDTHAKCKASTLHLSHRTKVWVWVRYGMLRKVTTIRRIILHRICYFVIGNRRYG